MTLYETEYQREGHFSFGRNWQDFLKTLTAKRLETAEESLRSFLGLKSLEGRTFIDIGSGSGLFSLAAYKLKAKQVISVDIDEYSLACTKFLRDKEGQPANWLVKKGSALDRTWLKDLGQFDIVYSWGVLHHTGQMHQALSNVIPLVKPDGLLYISIYNHSQSLKHGRSSFWLKAKKHYNQSNKLVKASYFWLYSSYLVLGMFLLMKNPLLYIRGYQSARGMSWKHDVLDWLGGYPYEFAKPSEIIHLLGEHSLTVKNLNLVNSIGCSEYLFTPTPTKLSAVTVLMSVHNSADTLDRALESVEAQTLKPQIVCVNDASTDGTSEKLTAWQQRLGSRIKVITNTENLGLTRSLNKGLNTVTTPYTARIDADDWWEPTKLAKQVSFLDANPDYGVVGCWYTNYAGQTPYRKEPAITDQAIRQSIIHQNPFAHSCVVFRTELVKAAGSYDEQVRYGQDYELWLRLLPKTKFFNYPENLCHRSINSGISIDKQREQMKHALKTRRHYIKQYRLGPRSYFSLLEPWLVSITPQWLANWKRSLR